MDLLSTTLYLPDKGCVQDTHCGHNCDSVGVHCGSRTCIKAWRKCCAHQSLTKVLRIETWRKCCASKLDESAAHSVPAAHQYFFQWTNLAKTPTPPNDAFSLLFANVVNYGRPLKACEKEKSLRYFRKVVFAGPKKGKWGHASFFLCFSLCALIDFRQSPKKKKKNTKIKCTCAFRFAVWNPTTKFVCPHQYRCLHSMIFQ